MPLIMGLDLGTTAIKCLVMNEHGKTVSLANVPYPTYSPRSGWVEQRPDDWLKAMQQAIQECGKQVNIADVAAISLSGHMSALVLVDREGEALMPAITLSDTRSEQQSARLRSQYSNLIFEMTGNPVINAFLLPKLMWVKEHYPAILAKTAYVLFPKDYLRYNLTGLMKTDVTDAGNSLLFDLAKKRWNTQLIASLELDQNLFPEVFPSNKIAGHLAENVAKTLGMKAGTPVITGAADMACAALGSGLTSSETAVITVGTSATVFTLVDRFHEEIYEKLTFHPHVFPNSLYALGSHFSGGLSINWLTRILTGTHSPDYSLIQSLSKQAEHVEAGSNGLLFLPFLVGSGSPYFKETDRASFIGLNHAHDQHHILRAAIEGISYNLKETVDLFSKMGNQIKTIRAGGGGMKISIWPQILSDILNRPVELMRNTDAAAVGAALLAGHGIGIFPKLDEASATAVSTEATFTPVPERVKSYESLFNLYKSAYEKLRQVVEGLHSI